MILAEISIILLAITTSYGIKVLAKKYGYKIRKTRLRKLLLEGFTLMDPNLIKIAITSLKDFDGKYSTNKLDKYLLEIIQIFNSNDEKITLNEKNVLNLVNKFIFDNILDDEEEEEKQKDEIEEKIEENREILNEVEKRRKEIMLRKNQIRQKQVGKSAKRRSTGGMG